MGTDILYTLFEDNPELPEHLFRFCQTIPACTQAEEELERLSLQVEQQLDGALYEEFTSALFNYVAQENRACYLFGLGLCRQVLEGFFGLTDQTGGPARPPAR